MRLDKGQREKVLKLVAAGLKTDAINARLSRENPPIVCTRQQIDRYRKTCKIKIKDIIEKAEKSALKRGLALKENRIRKLARLAERLERDLFQGKKLWLRRERGIGSGPVSKIVIEYEFNEAEVRQYRGLLDDLARETGGRAAKIEDGDGKALAVFQVIRAPGVEGDG